MTCAEIDCEQRTPQWFAARAGLLTSTGAAAMLSGPKKGGGDTVGKAELRLRLALESMRGVPLDEDGFESAYMRRGKAREPDGIGAYEAMTGEIVQAVGFLRHDTLPIGCSPDGIVGDFEGGLELKCPKFTTHYEYLQKGGVPHEYVPQMMHALLVTGLPWWDFCSYCPEFDGPARLFVVRLWRNSEDLAAYELAVSLFWTEVEAIKATLCALRAPEMSHA
jgi:hypothetical protein